MAAGPECRWPRDGRAGDRRARGVAAHGCRGARVGHRGVCRRATRDDLAGVGSHAAASRQAEAPPTRAHGRARRGRNGRLLRMASLSWGSEPCALCCRRSVDGARCGSLCAYRGILRWSGGGLRWAPSRPCVLARNRAIRGSSRHRRSHDSCSAARRDPGAASPAGGGAVCCAGRLPCSVCGKTTPRGPLPQAGRTPPKAPSRGGDDDREPTRRKPPGRGSWAEEEPPHGR